MTCECLQCGFLANRASRYCPKCDAELGLQTDGSTITQDIAHRGQTIDDAIDALRRLLEEADADRAQFIRAIVGRGRIRDALCKHLDHLKRAERIRNWTFDGTNQGAVMIRLRDGQ